MQTGAVSNAGYRQIQTNFNTAAFQSALHNAIKQKSIVYIDVQQKSSGQHFDVRQHEVNEAAPKRPNHLCPWCKVKNSKIMQHLEENSPETHRRAVLTERKSPQLKIQQRCEISTLTHISNCFTFSAALYFCSTTIQRQML